MEKPDNVVCTARNYKCERPVIIKLEVYDESKESFYMCKECFKDFAVAIAHYNG